MKPIKPSDALLKQIEEFEDKKTKTAGMDSKIMLMSNSYDREIPEYFIRVDYLKTIKNHDTVIKSALMVKGEEIPEAERNEDGVEMPRYEVEPDSIEFGLEFWQVRNPDVPYFVDSRTKIQNLKDLIETESKHNCSSVRSKAELKRVRDRYNFLMETRKVALTEMRDRIKNNLVVFLKRD